MTLFSSPIVLVLVGVIGLLIGLLVGFLFIDRDSRKSRTADVPEEFSKDGFMEIARMLYSPDKKRIITGLDGEFFKETREMSAEQHTRLTKVLRIWSEWNSTPGAAVEETVSPVMETLEPPKPVAEESAAVEKLPETPAEEKIEEIPASEMNGEVFSAEPVPAEEPMAWTPFIEEAAVSDVLKEETPLESEAEPALAEVPAVEAKNLTIVEQINQTLQAMLPGTAYEYRGLALEDDRQNGVLVYAGSERFNGIDSVPYADAQELIRNAVTEWERKYESEQNKPA